METYGLEKLGIINAGAVYRNLTPAQLGEHALRRGEGTLSNTGALVVKTGKYTGRSANDKFIVDTPAVHDDIAWGKVNRPMDKARFDAIYAKVTAYLQNKEVYVFDGFAGADPKYTKGFRIVNELASQNLFIHQLLRRPTADQLKDFHEDYTIIAAPGFKCIPEIDGTRSEAAILVDYEAHLVVICGTQYAGEIKKDGNTLTVKRMLEDGYMTVKVKTPCMITCIKELNQPRYLSVGGAFEAYSKPLVTMTYETLKDHPLIDKSTIGLAGSPTNILTSFTPPQKGAGMMLEGAGKETTDKLAGILAAKHII